MGESCDYVLKVSNSTTTFGLTAPVWDLMIDRLASSFTNTCQLCCRSCLWGTQAWARAHCSCASQQISMRSKVCPQ